MFCKSGIDSLTSIVSSAYKSVNSLSRTSDSFTILLDAWVIPWQSVKCFSRSLRYIANNSGERFSPCLTPALQLNRLELLLFTLTQDLAD